MDTLPSINHYSNKTPTVLTIGTFDGVHIGHQKILERLLEEAQQRQLNSLVLTFFPHPRRVLQKDSDLQWLTTLEEKKQILDRMGLDVLVVLISPLIPHLAEELWFNLGHKGSVCTAPWPKPLANQAKRS